MCYLHQKLLKSYIYTIKKMFQNFNNNLNVDNLQNEKHFKDELLFEENVIRKKYLSKNLIMILI